MRQQKPEQVDLANEINLMASFVTARWQHVEHVETLFHDLARVAQKATETGLPELALTSYLYEKASARSDLLKQFDESGGVLRYYDQPYLLLDNIQSALHDYQSAQREVRYEADCKAYKGFKKFLKSEYAHMKKAQPSGLRTMLMHCRSDNEIWHKALGDEYPDSHSIETALAWSGQSFARDISLISVVQTVDHHNTPAVGLLMSSAYKHLVQVFLNNNACEVIADLEKLAPECARLEPVFELSFVPVHRITKALVERARAAWRALETDNPEQGYREAVEGHKARKPLTEDEKLANRAKALRYLREVTDTTAQKN